ncbi:hypothetical protein ABIB90_002556 [Bradyrhizobium sp. JR4.1]
MAKGLQQRIHIGLAANDSRTTCRRSARFNLFAEGGVQPSHSARSQVTSAPIVRQEDAFGYNWLRFLRVTGS